MFSMTFCQFRDKDANKNFSLNYYNKILFSGHCSIKNKLIYIIVPDQNPEIIIDGFLYKEIYFKQIDFIKKNSQFSNNYQTSTTKFCQ